MDRILFQYEMNPTTWVYLSSLIIIGIYFKFARFWSVRNLDLVLLLSLAPGILLVQHDHLLHIGRYPALTHYGYAWLFVAGFLLLLRLLIDPAMVRRPLLEPNLSTGGLTFMGTALMVFLTASVLTRQLDDQALLGSRQLDQFLTRHAAPPEENGLDRFGPGYALLHTLGRLPSAVLMPAEEGLPPQQHRMVVHRATTRTMAILGHFAVVIAMVLIGYRHFDNVRTGIAAAALYLLLPYTAHLADRVDHVLAAAVLLWALVFYRWPLVAGLLLGLAAGSFYYPIFLVPLWVAFYWQRGAVRFALGVVAMLALLAGSLILVADTAADYAALLQQTLQWLRPTGIEVGGFWDFNSPAYRIPLLATFVVLAASFALWPAQKNLGTLMSCSAAVMLGTQFWHAHQGGLCVNWYLPLLLLTVFRPNLEDRVALSVLGEARLPKRLVLWSRLSRAA